MNTDETKKGTIKFRKSLIFKMILAVAISLYISSHISNFINDQIDKVDKINGSLEVTINTFVSLFIATFIISLSTRFIVIKRIDKVLNAMTLAAKGDLTIRLEDKSKDEIGQLSYYFNNMIDNIETVIQKAKKASLKVSSYTEEFTSIADQNSSSVEKIANFNKGIVSGSDVQVNKTMILSESFQAINEEMRNVSHAVRVVSDVAGETNLKADLGLALIELSIDKMNTINASVKESTDVVNALGEKSQEIRMILELITRITYQTNILAINASIEAAQAGEAGKGFAVVADRVRKLAEEAGKATSDIKILIDDILSKTSNAVKSINNGSQFVDEGREVVEQSGEAFKDIVEYIHQINIATEEVKSIVLNVNKQANKTNEAIVEIAEVAEDTSSSLQIIALSIEQQTASNEEIASYANVLDKMSSEIIDEISRFKIKQ
ncbi:hypothetical protein ABE61_02030 [Lysinibacillus sphaericus]|uniref:methyl-accepting chemotaxis protein n=1 Tax=Lysinibacillus sphaericus TaxID=1421 RepID=UPI0018CD213C|nr:methyl-accepting chemotaxis protein [Lysinibacillus sphaericus]MBG9452895.1 hypothetical protein [Lysinibacillus sphaericus]MBG9480102.1 hypothetical protein [Lysinibacillus sphaericus]MBG9593706.1 hypothetical protein [Lysinibacillus sphaericus]